MELPVGGWKEQNLLHGGMDVLQLKASLLHPEWMSSVLGLAPCTA